jgi:phosphate uptake regulator
MTTSEEDFLLVPEPVMAISTKFNGIGELLKDVAKALEAVINTLKVAAFIGLVGAAAIARFLETIKPYIEQVADKCIELSQDLKVSVEAFQNGDARGATRFY